MDEGEVKLIRDIIQEVIIETSKNRPIGSTETARIIITELDKYRKSKNDNNPPCGWGNVKKIKKI